MCTIERLRVPPQCSFSGIRGRRCFLLSFPVSLCSGHSPTSGIYRSATGHTCAPSTRFSNVQPPMHDPRCASLVSSSDRNRLGQQDPYQQKSPNNSGKFNVPKGLQDAVRTSITLLSCSRVLTVWEELSGLRLGFAERCDCGYRVQIGEPIYRFCMGILVS